MLSAAVNRQSLALGTCLGAFRLATAKSRGMDTLADRIRRYRVVAGLSQAQLAEKMGVKPSSVAQWELDQTRPASHRFPLLSEILGVSVPFLMSGATTEEDERRARLAQIAANLDVAALDDLIRIALRFRNAA